MTRQIRSRVGMKGAENSPADVRTIQELLNSVPPNKGGPNFPLTVDGICGEKTKSAIQNFQLHHFGWQLADGRVDPGGPTLARLNELSGGVVPPVRPVCTLYFACPPDAGGRPARSGMNDAAMFGFAPTQAASNADIMKAARQSSRRSLWDARGDLLSVTRTLRAKKPLSAAQEKTYTIATKWLNLNQETNRPDGVIAHIEKAANLMLRNHNLKTSTGSDVEIRHAVGKTYHAASYGHPNYGMDCGDPFFSPDGPNCRRDVVTHEFFHMIGVEHGGCPGDGATIRARIRTPAQALNSADNLAQLVAELRTFKLPNTDACTRPGD